MLTTAIDIGFIMVIKIADIGNETASLKFELLVLQVTITMTPTNDITRQNVYRKVSLSLRNMFPSIAVNRGIMFVIKDIRTNGRILVI